RAGPAYRTATQLELRRDHAAAVDAVQAEFDLERDLGRAFADRWRLFEVQTRAGSKGEYLLRPDLGRRLGEAARAEVARLGVPGTGLAGAPGRRLLGGGGTQTSPASVAALGARGPRARLEFRPALCHPLLPRGPAQRARRAARPGGGRAADRGAARSGDGGQS